MLLDKFPIKDKNEIIKVPLKKTLELMRKYNKLEKKLKENEEYTVELKRVSLILGKDSMTLDIMAIIENY